MGRQTSEDVVRSTDTTAEVQVETSDISNKFKFFETYKEPAKERKQFRITPPRDGQEKVRPEECSMCCFFVVVSSKKKKKTMLSLIDPHKLTEKCD